jgi:hypothetical protein
MSNSAAWRGLILDALLAHIDDATVADALQIFLPSHEHEREPFYQDFPEDFQVGMNDSGSLDCSKWTSPSTSRRAHALAV